MDSPLILHLQKDADLNIYHKLLKSGAVLYDHFYPQLQELYAIRYPKQKLNKEGAQKYATNYKDQYGDWVYYPWRNTLIHIVSQKDYYELRTARNFPLIDKKTQSKLHNLRIAIAGLSVGSNIVRSLVYAGVGSTFHLADSDILATSNLNRSTSNLLDLGKNKCNILAMQLWELDPYLNLVQYNDGLNATNFKNFLTKGGKVDVVFDEVDDISLKPFLKLAAYTLSIPHFMVTDNGYTAEIDSTTFRDKKNSGGLEQSPKVNLLDITSTIGYREPLSLTPKEEQDLINSLIGSEDRAEEMKSAGRLKYAQKIVGWPQLQAVASVGASLAVFALISLVNNTLRSGKKMISLN